MTPDMLMCRGCGEFVTAIPNSEDEQLDTVVDACPECDGTEFKDTQTDTVVRVDDRTSR